MSPRGVVLTGGRSTRMGTDKALLRLDGVALAARVAAVLASAGCHPVVCQGGDGGALAELGFEVVPDTHPGEGPVVAILDALSVPGGAATVVSACDLPAIDVATVSALLEAAASRPSADAVVAATDRVPHLLGIWRPQARHRLAALVNEGVRSYRAALERVDTVLVDVPASVVVNVNTPEDLP